MKQALLTYNEICIISNILNEVCHGILINNFENSIGTKKNNVKDLLFKIGNKINNIEDGENIILSIKDDELIHIRRSFKEVLKQIEEWEFSIRIGATIEEMHVTLNKFF